MKVHHKYWLHNKYKVIKHPRIEIKKSAQIASQTLRATEKWLIERGQQDIEKGINGSLTSDDIDKFVFDRIVEQGAYPTPIGFMGFPKSVCISIN